MIRLGLIGCGEHAEGGHAIPLARYRAAHPEEIELAAATDLRLERARGFCSKYGFLTAYRDADEMLRRENLDGCITVVPPEKIAELGIKLLKLGVPCVVEKPLGISLAEVNLLQNAAVTTRTLNMVSVNRRFMPFLNRAMDWVSSAGSLRYVRCTLARHERREPAFLWATAVHAVDTLRYIGGEVREFEVHASSGNGLSSTWYAVDLQFENGTSGCIDVLPTTGMVEETHELFGEGFRASATCPFGALGWRGFRGGRLAAEETAGGQPEDVLNGCYDEASTFIRALARKAALTPSIADVAPSVALCLALAEKCKSAIYI